MRSFLLASALLLLLPSFLSAQWIQKGGPMIGEGIFDEFGTSVSMPNAITIAVGGQYNDGNAINAGHVRVYRFNGNFWVQKGSDIDGETYGDRSGCSISMPNDSVLAIGALANNGGGTESGHARVYRWNGSAWVQKGADIDGAAIYDHAGTSVSMPDGNTLAIGAPNNDSRAVDAGHVRIYRWTGSAWVQKGGAILGEAYSDLSGSSVSMPDSNTVAIGAPDNNGSGAGSGHVRVYRWTGNAWVKKGADLNGESAGDKSGFSVSMPDSNTVAIGAYNNNQRGHVRIYEWIGSSWVQKGADIDGESSGDQSGYSVSMPDHKTVAIGARANTGIGRWSGHVRVFEWVNSSWVQKGSDIDGSTIEEESGTSVSMPDSVTVGIGSPHATTQFSSDGLARAFYFLPNITSLEDQQLSKLSFYPNPTKGQLFVESKNPEDELLQITDLNGKLLKEIHLTSSKEKVDLSQFSAGIYLIKYQGQTEKLVVVN